ncbi:MAG TPA: tyrosine-type recombinase/integrase [Anaerolineae bacterium]|nr:tyrosine-type recombinase/integrase [Anaerolineae bacterium]HQK13678.1 tyrosine-type recombinase/integrase [Anaerolineae bacterium]
MTLHEAVKEFLLAKLAGGRSPRTLKRYEEVLTAFETLVGGRDLADVTPRHIRRFLASYRTRGCTPETLLSHYNVLRCFFNWLQREYQLTHNPIGAVDRPLVPSLLPKSLTADQVKALLKAVTETRKPERNTALVMLMLDTGIRVGEACNLQREHIDLENRHVRVFGKDKRERQLPVGEKTTEAFKVYFETRNDDLPSAFVTFRGESARPMTVRVVQSLFKRLSKVVGFHVNPHLLRSTFGSIWITNGGDEESLRQMLGHTTYAMTRRYVRLRMSDLHDKHAKFSPLAGGKEKEA